MPTPAPSDSPLIPLPVEGADLRYLENTPILDTDQLFQRLLRETPWQQHNITLFGNTHPQPRLEAWYGDAGATYRYSGIQHDPLPWTDDLATLRNQLEVLCDARFNSVLLNLYRSGEDSMGLHADDEPELGVRPVIASLSLGAERRMYFRHRSRAAGRTQSIDLPHGSLLVMAGDTQRNWKHGIRKTRRPCGPRINLTFRMIIHPR